MAIVRYENLAINNVTNGVNAVGEYTTTITKWFDTRGLVHDVSNTLRISERYRVYSDLVNTSNPVISFEKAQKEMRNKYPTEPTKWAGFVLVR
jgi:hypothetical protein